MRKPLSERKKGTCSRHGSGFNGKCMAGLILYFLENKSAEKRKTEYLERREGARRLWRKKLTAVDRVSEYNGRVREKIQSEEAKKF